MNRLWSARTFQLALILPILTNVVPAADQGQLDGNITLFTMWAALDRAGVMPPSSASPLRDLVRAQVQARAVPVAADIRKFVERRRKPASVADLGPYISFALSVEGPPNFKFRYRTLDLSPEVGAMEGFNDLLKKFYEQAEIGEIWPKAQPAVDQEIAKYHLPTTEAVMQVNVYLRNVTSGFLGRRFQIYLDPLGPPNLIQTRSYGDDYFVALTASDEPKTFDVRHAYLHYLLDPTATKYGEDILKKKGIGDFAQPAPALPEQFKSDFLLLTTECLIKAVESRLERSGRQERVDQALSEGYILAPFFAEQLVAYEKQEAGMRMYFPDMLAALDLKKEDERLKSVRFASAAAQRPVRKVTVAEEPTGVEKTLDSAEQLYVAKQLEKARDVFAQALRETAVPSFHAKAYYGLARIALQERHPDLAEKLFQKTIELGPDPFVKAWSHVYLGRLAEAAGEQGQATVQYQAALGVEGASEAARKAAEKGISQTLPK
ncbi:MAG: tetratricopeptide repeat protein [Bryobacteraceae bacterium]